MNPISKARLQHSSRFRYHIERLFVQLHEKKTMKYEISRSEFE